MKLIDNGINTRTTISNSADVKNLVLEISGINSKVIIEDGCIISGKIKIFGNNSLVKIGIKTAIDNVLISCGNGQSVVIGSKCKIERDVVFSTSDGISILDMSTGKRINLSNSINIGDKVLIGQRSFINKGSNIAKNSIVKERSFVNREFAEEYSLIVGSPAEVVEKNVTWEYLDD